MRPKVAAFHIGAHKTGTSLLQRYVRTHAERLAKQGLSVLTRSEMSQYISWGDALVETPERLVQRVASFLVDDRFRVLFGSNENAIGRPFLRSGHGQLYPRGPSNVRALARAIRGDCRPRIFLSIRPQHEFIESYYLQTVHEGGSATFHDWLEQVDFAKLSWRPLVDEAWAWFGPENVEIIDFRIIRRHQSDYVRRFLGALDESFDGSAELDAPVNRSISEKGLRIALAVNPYLTESANRGAMRRFLQQHFSNVHYPRPVLLEEQQRQELIDRYAVEYDELVGAQQCVTTSGPGHP